MELIDFVQHGVCRLPATSQGDYPSPKSNEWDGPAQHSGRVVRCIF